MNEVVYFDMDGVVADFVQGYKNVFGGLIDYNTDPFTTNQTCLSEPRFFRMLPILERGKALFDELRKKYQVMILTTPMQGMDYCKIDKIAWVKEYLGEGLTILFSDSKADYAHSNLDFLIDDMDYNLEPWAEAGGTALNFRKMTNEEIIKKIENTINPVEEIKEIKRQLKDMQIELKPSEAQKESGNYKKGDVVIKGLKIKVENPKGSIRFGFDDSGKKWMSRMKHHYGYIQHSGDAIDGDKIDVFIGENHITNKAFVVNQGRSGMFDEHKVLLGFNDINEAKAAYLSNYEKGWEKNILSIEPTNTKQLRGWLEAGNFKNPFKAQN